MVVEFNTPSGNLPVNLAEPKRKMIQFQPVGNEDPDAVVSVIVTDKFPQMGDIHVEARHVVEVSVELYIQFMEMCGYEPIVPAGAVAPAPEGEEV